MYASTMSLWADIARAIVTAIGEPFRIDHRTAVGGGYLGQAERMIEELLATV